MGELRRPRVVIVLLEPRRPPGFVSGGYRYQHEIMRRLTARGEGELRAVAPDELDATIDAVRRERRDAVIVVDGLFAELTRRELPENVIALLHTVPGVRVTAHRMIVTSDDTADVLGHVLPPGGVRAIHVVRPGLDDCFVAGDARERSARLRVVCIGTVSALKNQRLVAAALAAVATDVPCELVLLGDVKTEPDAARAVTAAAGDVPAYFAGVVSPERVAAELHRADLFVSASRSESFGMAVAEAAACGTPVLAFRTGEIDTFVHDGENGWLVDTNAGEAVFTARLHELLRSPLRLDAARGRARRPLLRSWDDTARQFASACRSLAERG